MPEDKLFESVCPAVCSFMLAPLLEWRFRQLRNGSNFSGLATVAGSLEWWCPAHAILASAEILVPSLSAVGTSAIRCGFTVSSGKSRVRSE